MQQPKQVLLDKCPECNHTNFVYDDESGETVCGSCGLVINSQTLNKGPEWRAFTLQEKASRSRVGIPTAYSTHDKGLSTGFRVERDAWGKKLSKSTSLQMWRLRKWQIRSRVYSYIDRNLAQAMTELNRLADKLSISYSIKEKAALIYRKALDKGLVRGRSIVTITAAALYVACRINKSARTLNEIAKVSLVHKKKVTCYYRLILKELNIKMPIDTPITYVSKIAETLGISNKTQGVAVRILMEAKKRRVTAGKNPVGLVASALYVSCLRNNEKQKQKDVAEAAGVTEVTIRNLYKTLNRQSGLEL